MPEYPFKMTVTGGPPVGGSFLATVTPPEQAVPAGTSASYNVAFEAVGGFDGLIEMDVLNLPNSASASIQPNPAHVADTVTVVITTEGVFPGTYDLLLKAEVAGTLPRVRPGKPSYPPQPGKPSYQTPQPGKPSYQTPQPSYQNP